MPTERFIRQPMHRQVLVLALISTLQDNGLTHPSASGDGESALQPQVQLLALQPLQDRKDPLLSIIILDKETGSPVAAVKPTVIPVRTREGTQERLIVPFIIPREWAEAETGPDGALSMSLQPNQEYLVHVAVDGYEAFDSYVGPLILAEEAKLTIALSRVGGYFAWIRVIDAQSHAAVPGASVSTWDKVRNAFRQEAQTTDSSGLLRLIGDPICGIAGVIRSERFGDEPILVWPTNNSEATPQLIRVRAPSNLTFRVTGDLGVPVGKEEIILTIECDDQISRYSRGPSEETPIIEWVARTDDSGCARFGTLPGGRAFWVWHAEGSARRLLQRIVTRNAQATVDLPLGLVVISGTLVDEEGDPVPDCQIAVAPARSSYDSILDRSIQPSAISTTDEQGRFTLDSVAAGRWWVYPRSTKFVPVTTSVDSTDGERVEGLTVVARQCAFLEGIVYEKDGVGVAGAYVRASHPGYTYIPIVCSNSEGQFEIGPLVAGEYSIEVWTVEGRRSALSSIHTGGKDLRIKLNPPHCVSGTVLSSAGVPASGLVIVSTPADYPRLRFSGVDRNGRFLVGGLPRSDCSIAILQKGGGIGIGRLASFDCAESAGFEAGDYRIVIKSSALVRVSNSSTATGTLVVGSEGAILECCVLDPGETRDVVVPIGKCMVGRLRENASIEWIDVINVVDQSIVDVDVELGPKRN